MNRKLRMGMVGGGQGAFIGAVHRMASVLDNEIELVCGAFSSSTQRSKDSGKELYLAPNRIYATYEEMIKQEALIDEDERMDFISIVTPNHLHFAPAKLALENGFHVVCDKPMTISVEEAEELKTILNRTKLIFALTHNYTGYPMVKQAKKMISEGVLGNLRKVVVEYPQGWLSTALEKTGQKQAAWRSNPAKSGGGGAIGDIGTHAANLAEYLTNAKIIALCADLTTFVEDRLLDDDANILIRMENNIKGVLHCSQISAGEENALVIRIYGEKGGLEWHQQQPNTLLYKQQDAYQQVLRPGVGELYPIATDHVRLPAGHPEGFIEAFANIYRNFAYAVKKQKGIVDIDITHFDFPSVDEGIRGMKFIHKVIESSKSNQKWTSID